MQHHLNYLLRAYGPHVPIFPIAYLSYSADSWLGVDHWLARVVSMAVPVSILGAWIASSVLVGQRLIGFDWLVCLLRGCMHVWRVLPRFPAWLFDYLFTPMPEKERKEFIEKHGIHGGHGCAVLLVMGLFIVICGGMLLACAGAPSPENRWRPIPPLTAAWQFACQDFVALTAVLLYCNGAWTFDPQRRENYAHVRRERGLLQLHYDEHKAIVEGQISLTKLYNYMRRHMAFDASIDVVKKAREEMERRIDEAVKKAAVHTEPPRPADRGRELRRQIEKLDAEIQLNEVEIEKLRAAGKDPTVYELNVAILRKKRTDAADESNRLEGNHVSP